MESVPPQNHLGWLSSLWQFTAMVLPVLFQDDELIVVNKPSGLLVHRSAIDRHAREFALQMVRDQISRIVYPVHRLDKPTSGALLFGLSSSSARFLAREFGEGRVAKTYLAVVRGVLHQHEITLDYPLKEEPDPISDHQARVDKPAQAALTSFTHLASCELPICVDKFPTSRYSLVRATPKTGRKHQIRRHLRHLGHPVVGDVRYGSGKHNRFFRTSLGIQRLLLACTELSFQHPRENKMVVIRAPLAPEFHDVLVRLGWESHLA